MIAEYAALFLAGFLSGSILPMQSEAVFAAMLVSGRYVAWLLLCAVSLGNILGSVLNWGIGKYADCWVHHKWFGQKSRYIELGRRWFDRYGAWVLLLSWVPVIGDPLTVVAGLLSMRFYKFLAIVALAKTLRYAALMYIVT